MHRVDNSIYILRHANLITMENDQVLYDMDMFIANGKIYKIAKHIDISDVQEKDMTGKFIMPGLFDCHIHMDADDITEMLIACGVTTARNMWGMDETQQWIREIDRGERPGPHVYSTGPLTDGVTYWEGSKIVQTPEEGHQAVIDCFRDGYQMVKTYPSIPRDAFFEIMRTANELGIKVVGHGNYNVSFRELAESGYNTMVLKALNTQYSPNEPWDTFPQSAGSAKSPRRLPPSWTALPSEEFSFSVLPFSYPPDVHFYPLLQPSACSLNVIFPLSENCKNSLRKFKYKYNSQHNRHRRFYRFIACMKGQIQLVRHNIIRCPVNSRARN